MTGKDLLSKIDSEEAKKNFQALYGEDTIEEANKRYRALIEGFSAFAEKPARGERGPSKETPIREFPETALPPRLFSAPGRTELGGNHTDHNRGKVLAASIQLDAAAAAAPRQDGLVIFRSLGYPDAVVNLLKSDGSEDLGVKEAEKGSTEALIRGIAAEFAGQGTAVRGFTANASNTVFAGSGLSSSAAVEVLIAKIFDCLYGGGRRPPVELAKIGQKAENNYFGKPSGLEDQIACAFGGAVALDFKDAANPLVTPIKFDLASLGYALCVVNTGGSHADLTDDYASIPNEMRAVAACFGKTELRDCYRSDVLEKAQEIRKKLGDRAILRSLHFFSENSRVDDMRSALERTNTLLDDSYERQGALGRYLNLVTESGNSSWELLQNIYSPKNPSEQGIALALALSRNFLANRGSARVHGGGFAGVIQAYVPLQALSSYKKEMEKVFGPNVVTTLMIRQIGATEVLF
ncbi:MAG: galactokinase [Treponema sp.]|jgi:galactokinase|nr:galactokinase [Treponema sp.]